MRPLLSLLLCGGLSFGICGLDFPVELKYKVEKKVGKEYRRADVVVYLPVEGEEAERGEKGLARVKAKKSKGELTVVIDPTRNVEEEWFLFIPVKEGYLHEEAYLEKVFSNNPSIKEVYYIYPVDITNKGTLFLLPPSYAGERLYLKVKYEGKVGEPVVKTARKEEKKKKKPVKVVKVVYSFAFGYAKTETDNMNVENLRKLIDELSLAGKLKKVEIVGFADGKTKNPERNEAVARSRAISIAKKLFQEHRVACLVNERGVAKLTNPQAVRESPSP